MRDGYKSQTIRDFSWGPSDLPTFLMGNGRTVKILIVNSDPRNIHELAGALRSRGCTLFEATSYESGKRLWMTERPDVLIADVRLEQFNGLQLLLRAKAERPEIAAFITSSVQ